MAWLEGVWASDVDTGDDRWYRNYRAIDQLDELLSQRAFDIVIVGGGGSGAATAIQATDLGASVLILEKMATPGGSTQESGGTIRLVWDQHGTAEHFFALAQGSTPRDVIDTFVEELANIPDWVLEHGGELQQRSDEELDGTYSRWVFPASRAGTAFPNLPFADSLAPRTHMRPTRPDRVQGASMWDFLARNLEELDVPLVVGAKVTGLIQHFPERAIVGVEVETPNGTVAVSARTAVVLCCGGFAYDPEMMTQFLGIALPAMSPPGRATGDGIRMAQDVGADLWHMSATSTSVGYNPPELLAGFHCRMPAYGFVLVDQLARRYTCETDLENHSAPQAMMAQDLLSGEYLRIPSFVILDEKTRTADLLTMNERGENRHYPWSSDNSVEIEKGWIKRADTLTDLATMLGLPVEQLLATVEEFNHCCESGTTDTFGRTAERMRPISTPPYYGAAVRPTLLNTQGGPRRNAKGQILRPDGSPIAGLYGAGECGSIWSRLYPGAGNVSECLVSGRIAAKNALA